MAFDGSTIFTATTATLVGGVFTDTFDLFSTDVDMVRIDLVAGRLYQIDIDNGTAGDFHLRIFDAFGSEVRANDDGFRTNDNVVFSLSPWIEFAPNYSGTYYVAVSPYYMQGYDPASLAGRTAPENPIATTAGTLTILDNGTNFWPSTGSINSITAESSSDETDLFREEDGSLRVSYVGTVDSPTDVDIARIDLEKGDVVVIDVNGLESNGTVLRVINAAGTLIGFDDDSGFGDDPELSFAAPNAGTFYVGISGEGNATYNALDGTGTVAGVTGNYEVIVHRNPTQIGSSGTDTLFGNFAANYIVSLGSNDTVNGNDGDDTLAGGDDQDSLFGGNGLDVLYGEHGNDNLFGGNGSDVVSGGLGEDSLFGGAGNDVLSDGIGNDSLDGGQGADLLAGGLGNDNLFSGLGVFADTLRGDDGIDFLSGGRGTDLMFGGNDGDNLFAGNGNDTLNGDAVNDTMSGGNNDDFVLGDTGDDIVTGNAGNDVLAGGQGNDALNGGTGVDAFDFNSVADGLDIIEDLVLGTDRIDLATIFAATGSVVTVANLVQFVQVTPAGAGADSFLAIDADGAVGGLSFTIVAQVIGVTTVQLFDVDNFLL